MTRRNLSLLVVISVISLVCYQRANSANRAKFSQMFSNMVDVFEKVDERYVEKVNDEELFKDAMESMISKLDPYSSYMTPDDYAEMEQAIDGKFGGIGITLSADRDTKMLVVENPLVGTPAWENGVLAGDTSGFPNGRRLTDDVIDITLQVAVGVLGGVRSSLGDGVDRNDVPFRSTFPYLAAPHSGGNPWKLNPRLPQ